MKINRILLPKKQDQRGWLVENSNSSVRNFMRHFLISTSKPGAVRGGHYHKRKTEWFIVIKGRARIYFEDLKTKEKTQLEVSGEKPEMIEIKPKLAHAIKNIDKSKLYLLAVATEPLNPYDQDTFLYKIKTP